MAPVILQMDVHCLRCARKIRKAIEHLHGLVFVAGAADASTLQWRIESRTGKPVTVVSDGERCYPTYTRTEHLGPPQGYPPAYQPYAGGWAPVAPPQHHYAP